MRISNNSEIDKNFRQNIQYPYARMNENHELYFTFKKNKKENYEDIWDGHILQNLIEKYNLKGKNF